MKILNKSMLVLVAIIGSAAAASAPAAVILTVSDTRPGELTNTTPSSTLGSVASTATVPTTTYTITGLDLTSAGGGASETIAFDVTYTQTGGSAVQVNGFGNISVTGGENNQVDGSEQLTATVSLNSTTFAGSLALSFIQASVGGVSNDEIYNVLWDGGSTQVSNTSGTIATNLPNVAAFTLDPESGNQKGGTVNIAGFIVQITAAEVPEPASIASGLVGLLLITARRHR